MPENICALKDLPIWISYGEKEPAFAVENTNATIKALKTCGSSQIHLEIYAELSHSEAISTAYTGPELYQWFLAQIEER